MNTATLEQEHVSEETIQLVTFKVGEIVLGIDIAYVQEINRHLDVTPVPDASDMIHGVVNLRGDVVTVLDPHRIFGLPASETPDQFRNLVLRVEGERIGVMVDQVSDILSVSRNQLTSRPSNVRSVDRQFIDSVYLHDEKIVVVLSPMNLIQAIDHPGESN